MKQILLLAIFIFLGESLPGQRDRISTLKIEKERVELIKKFLDEFNTAALNKDEEQLKQKICKIEFSKNHDIQKELIAAVFKNDETLKKDICYSNRAMTIVKDSLLDQFRYIDQRTYDRLKDELKGNSNVLKGVSKKHVVMFGDYCQPNGFGVGPKYCGTDIFLLIDGDEVKLIMMLGINKVLK
ncbi:MAG: hypothetical protein NT150_12385 [Bacteroidetes bacterium]|nr:hypothetical protein [Bacteroidota bacterium]